MSDSKCSTSRRTLGRLSLSLILVPFLVGFDYPDSTGTYAKVSAGGGHYRFTPGCSRYSYGVDFQEAEISLQHRIATKPVDPSASIWSKMKPSHITFAAQGDLINKEIKVIAYDTTSKDEFSGPWSPAPGYPNIGTRTTAVGFAAGTRLGFDWKWIGTTVGAAALSYGKGESEGVGSKNEEIPNFLPIAGLRLGDVEVVYATYELLGSSPLSSGGGFLKAGVGGKFASTRIWAGYGTYPYRDWMPLLHVAHSFGAITASFTAQANPLIENRNDNYGLSFGLEYHLH